MKAAAPASGTTPDPATLAQLGRLDLRARVLVDGFLAGLHRSPRLGSSVEFAQHRGYVPGDDLRHLDWKVWARSERYVVRQYRVESNLTAWLLVDRSASMDYAGARAAGGQSKRAWSGLAAAAIAWMALLQSDAVGLATFAGATVRMVPPSSRRDHLDQLCTALDDAASEPRTDLAAALRQAAERIPRRGLVVLLSDLFAEPAELGLGVARLRHDGHDVLVVQVLDDDELHLPFAGQVEFHGLEGGQRLRLQPRHIRDAYQRELERHIAALAGICHAHGAEYLLANTAAPVELVLSAYVAKRGARLR